MQSAAYATNFKAQEEARLIAAVEEARERQRAIARSITFGEVCDAYRRFLIAGEKRYDKAASRIDNVEALLGRHRDAARIGWDEYRELIAEVASLDPQTQRHYAGMLTAMLNFAVQHRILASSALGKVPLPTVPQRNELPVTWTKKELAVILGPAMDQFEREQSERLAKPMRKKSARSERRNDSRMPLRGLCLVAYFTLMRPKNNFALEWGELDIARGTFKLDQHKNVNRGVKAQGPLQAQLLAYLRSVMPSNARGTIHPNPATGRPYTDIRKQWDRLIGIAGVILGYNLEGRKADFFTFRHTGASHLAEKTGHNPMLLVKMMGDTSVETVRKHYCNLDLEFMGEAVSGWELPTIDEEAGEGKWTTN